MTRPRKGGAVVGPSDTPSPRRPPEYPNPQGNRSLDIVCLDLDGTLAEDVWPQPWIGKLLPEGRTILKHYSDTGWAVVIHTARPWSHQDRVWEWLASNGLDNMVYDVVCGKPPAALYIDDKAWNPNGRVK